jgi:predicted kinase
VMCGPPGSGKSTWAQTHLPAARLLPDNPPGDDWRLLERRRQSTASEALRAGVTVVVDGCNLDAGIRSEWAAVAASVGVKSRLVAVDVPASVALRRNGARVGRRVPTSDMASYFARWPSVLAQVKGECWAVVDVVSGV